MKSLKPFEYQLQGYEDIRKAMRRNKRVIYQLATGGGKGVMIADIARQAIEKRTVPCISVHREEIFQQVYDNLRAFGVMPGVLVSGHYPMGGSPCYLSMVETYCRRMSKGMVDHLGIGFHILDEVHLGNYYKMVKTLDSHTLGVTATPKSTGNPELNEYFDELVLGPTIQQLIDLGRLVPNTTYSINHDFSKVKMRGKDYDERSLFEEFKKPKLWHGAVDNWFKHAEGLQTICYSVNTEHSNATMLQFRERGISAVHVDAKTSKEDRRAIFQGFREGKFKVLCNVGIATVGTDIPSVRCIIQNFATTSLPKHIQTNGRGARVAEEKDHFIIIDMGRNYIRHGQFGEEINWQRIFDKPSEAFTKEAKRHKRECDECGAVIKLTLNSCPYCGHTITNEEVEEKLLFGASTEEIKEYRHRTLPIDLRKPINQMSYPELKAYGHHMGYSIRWANIVHSKRRR